MWWVFFCTKCGEGLIVRSREEEVCYGCLCNPCVIGLLFSISVLHGASINGSRNVPFVTQKIHNTHCYPCSPGSDVSNDVRYYYICLCWVSCIRCYLVELSGFNGAVGLKRFEMYCGSICGKTSSLHGCIPTKLSKEYPLRCLLVNKSWWSAF